MILILAACSASDTKPTESDTPTGSDTDEGTVDGEDSEVAPPATGTIVVNEVVAKAAAGEADWVELYNLGSEDADLGGWSIADDGGHSYVFAPGKIVGAGEYLLVDANEFGFGLGSDDQVTLLQPDGSEADLADWEDGAAPLGTSWGRIPNGTAGLHRWYIHPS
jgi:hypothetical protein